MENLALFKLHLNICWLPLMAEISDYQHYVSSVYFETCFCSGNDCGALDIALQIYVKVFTRTGVM